MCVTHQSRSWGSNLFPVTLGQVIISNQNDGWSGWANVIRLKVILQRGNSFIPTLSSYIKDLQYFEKFGLESFSPWEKKKNRQQGYMGQSLAVRFSLTLLSASCLVRGSLLDCWRRLWKRPSLCPIRAFTSFLRSSHWLLWPIMLSSWWSRASTPCWVLSHWLRTRSTRVKANALKKKVQKQWLLIKISLSLIFLELSFLFTYTSLWWMCGRPDSRSCFWCSVPRWIYRPAGNDAVPGRSLLPASGRHKHKQTQSHKAARTWN